MSNSFCWCWENIFLFQVGYFFQSHTIVLYEDDFFFHNEKNMNWSLLFNYFDLFLTKFLPTIFFNEIVRLFKNSIYGKVRIVSSGILFLRCLSDLDVDYPVVRSLSFSAMRFLRVLGSLGPCVFFMQDFSVAKAWTVRTGTICK